MEDDWNRTVTVNKMRAGENSENDAIANID